MFENYKYMLENYGQHELFMINYILKEARKDCFLYQFRDKFVVLIKNPENILYTKNTKIIVSHIDSPRLDLMLGNPFIESDDGFFAKVVPYGGIIVQDWLNIPLNLVGRICTEDDEELFINTKNQYEFTITGLLPHLNGRFELENFSVDNLLIRLADSREVFFDEMELTYGIKEEDFELADLSFVPAFNVRELGIDKDLITGYGHDDKSCAFAQLQAFLDSESKDTKIAIFASYEEVGSAQTTGCQCEIINDIFCSLTGDSIVARDVIRNAYVISADVCAGYDCKFSHRFEPCANTILGKGIGIIPYLGQKRGNDSEFKFRNDIKKLAIKNNIPYQFELTKVTEGGGGTVSTFFATKGCYVIDVGLPVLAMHSPQEVISKKDLESLYKFYKAFYELE